MRTTNAGFVDLFVGEGELARQMRSLDWQRLGLGSPDTWPQPLRAMVRILLTSRYQMWMGWGPDLKFFYNDAYRPTLGVKHPWAIGQPAAAVWREIWPDVGPLIDHVMSKGESTYNEGMLLFLERSGFPEETYHTFSYSPLFDDEGSVAGLLCVVVEETERIISARRMATMREFASAAANTTQSGELFRALDICLGSNLHDLPFTLTYLFDDAGEQATLVSRTGIDAGHDAAPSSFAASANPWATAPIASTDAPLHVSDLASRFGLMPSGAWNKPCVEAVVLPIAQQGSDRAAGFFVAGLNPYRRLDDAYRDFLSLLIGQIAGALANARGFEQERKRAEALAQIDRAKTAFFSNVSHEFRTPLTLMLGPLEELLAPADSSADQVRAQAQLAHRNGMRLLRLVNSLLDFSRIEAGRVNAAYEATDLVAYSAEIASSFRAAIEKAGLELIVEATPLSQPVFVDREMWEKVLLNLLSNAFKYTLQGEIRLRIQEHPDGRLATVSVSDSGIGIPEQELPRLFERFHRVQGAQGRSFEGTGIGLALVQELVKLHGGSVVVTSRVGQGTTFSVNLPFGRDHLPAERIRSGSSAAAPTRAMPFVEEALRWLPEPPEAERTSVLQPGALGVGRAVLLVDDNADMREYVSRLLLDQNYRVDTAEDGVLALAKARANNYDLIVTDVMMPNLDGFGLLQALRADPRLATVPVIMLSARAGDEARAEGIEAGADDYLTKPFAARELLARIHTNIQMAQVRRAAARAERNLQISQERLARALSTGQVAVYDWNVTEDRLSILGRMTEAFGVSVESGATGLPLETFIAGIHPDDRERVAQQVRHTVQSGEAFEAEYRLLGLGDVRTVLSRGQIEEMPNGERRFSGILIDMTQEKVAERQLSENAVVLRERARELQILNRTAALIAGEVRTANVVQAITDAGVELLGAQFGAFFYNLEDEKGERYTLYTLAGAPREAFSSYPMPRNTAVFKPTFEGTAIVRSEDITRDARYGHSEPYRGMPQGHLPVRSYLAAPVKSSSGEVLGGLFFGHGMAGVFGERSEELIATLAANAAVAMDNARLVETVQRELQQRRDAETRLQHLNSTLEQRIREEVTERLRAEEALRQAQKMEAVGQLTGGVAHDFNNLLTVIIGGLDTIKRASVAEEVRIRRAADMALQGAQRAAQLTSRLLAFSRRQPLDPRPLDLNMLVRDMTEMLHRTLGEQIELEGVMAPRLWIAEVDQNQLEAAVLNLAVNARDAMPEGGKLTIETANTALDESYVATDAEVIPGQYVMVAVSDTGTGMTKENLARAFEPFFTTKEVGRGTGLGLSMVYGFVKQSGGHVTLYSEPGQGTTVKLYFPRYRGEGVSPELLPDELAPPGHQDEVVLVVEDNEEVRTYSVMVLGELGYRVLEARHAEEALAIIERAPRIDLLFTDVILPGRSGKSLADAARALKPQMRVLYTTGYSRNAIVHHGRLDAGVQLISKPFTFEELAKRVRDILDKS